MIHEEPSGAKNRQKSLVSFFAALNNNYSAHNRHREPKLIWLELSGHEDCMCVNERAMQNV
jgi:hypothetical protein